MTTPLPVGEDADIIADCYYLREHADRIRQVLLGKAQASDGIVMVWANRAKELSERVQRAIIKRMVKP